MLRASRRRRALATVLFTDIVGSTARAEELGDAQWRALLRDHHRLVRRLLRRHRGREVDTAGDGFFATFGQPADAIACALEAADAVAELGIQIRAGIHTGEVEPMGAKVGGIAVHLGARILGAAEPGQIVVSSTVRDLVTGAGFTFVDLGTHRLKGVAEEWRLYAVVRPAPRAASAERPADRAWWRRRSSVIPALALVGLVAVSFGGALLIARGVLGPPASAISSNVVRAISPDGGLGDGFAVGRGPAAVTSAAGVLWVANTYGGTVSRVSPSVGQDAVVGVGVPTDLAATDGLIWVLDPFASTLSVIDPGDARLLQTVEVHGRSVSATEDAIWLADDINDTVHRVDPRTRRVEADIELPNGSAPWAIAATSDAVWVVNVLSGTVSRIDPSTNELVVESLALTSPPSAIAAGEDSVWVASASADIVMRIDPATNRVGRQEQTCDRPTDLVATGQDVIVACAGDRSVWRISGTGAEPIITEIDGAPSGLADDGDLVWVTVRES